MKTKYESRYKWTLLAAAATDTTLQSLYNKYTLSHKHNVINEVSCIDKAQPCHIQITWNGIAWAMQMASIGRPK